MLRNVKAIAIILPLFLSIRKPPSQTWRTFPENHTKGLVSTDFFVAPTDFFKVLFVFVILSYDPRRPVYVAVSEYPTAGSACFLDANPEPDAVFW